MTSALASALNSMSLLDRFQGTLLGISLAMGDAHQPLIWQQTMAAIAQRVLSESVVSGLVPADSENNQAMPNETLWSQGLRVLPVVLADFDQLHDWRCYEVIIASYRDGLADLSDRYPERPSQLTLDSQKATVTPCYLPYALVPCTLAAILDSGLNSKHACQVVLESLDKYLQTESSLVTEQAAESLCGQLLQCVKNSIDAPQSSDIFLRNVQYVVNGAIAPADHTTGVSAQIAADGVLVSVLLYCLMSTPEEYDVTMRRFRRILNCEEMRRFEELQPYLKLSQPSAIATLGGLLGAAVGQSSLSLLNVHTMLVASESEVEQPQYHEGCGKTYTELMVWGMQLWCFWSGMDPNVCLPPDMAEGATQSSSSEIMANIGVTASPNLIRMFGH